MTSAAPGAPPPLSPLGAPSPTAASPSSSTAATASWAVKKMRYVVESPPPSDSPGVISALTDVAHLLQRPASTAAGGAPASTPSPALTSTDGPTLYNTAATRRSLRTAMEARTLARAASVLSAADDVTASLSALTTDVAAMASLVDDLSQRLAAARSGAAGVVATTSALRDAATEHERCAAASAAFVSAFVLPPEEDAKLEAGIVDAGYLHALRRLEGLHTRSRVLLRAGATGRAALGTLEMAATRREAAYEAVYRAVQARCGELSTEGDADGDRDGMEDGQDGWALGGGRAGGDSRSGSRHGGGGRGSQLETTALVRSAVAALRARPRLLRLCADEVAAARRAALVGRFLRALTKGGPGGVPRPIELHAHDVLRYTNDMLAWVHQALAGETELIGRLFGEGEEEDGKDGSAHEDGEQRRGDGGDGTVDGDGSATDRGAEAPPRSLSSTVLHSIFDSLCRPLRTRLDALLDPPPPVVTTYRLASLIAFYATTLAVHLRPPSALVETLSAAQAATLGAFFASWRERLDAFVADTPPPSSADLSPPPAVSATMRRLGDILATLDASLASEAERDASAAQVLDAILTPLRQICVDAAAGARGGGAGGGAGGGTGRRSSDMLGGTRGARGRSGGLSAAERCVYLANCVDAMRTPLEGYPFTAAVVASLDVEAEGYLDEYVHLASEEVLRAVGLADRVAAARSWLAGDASGGTDGPDDVAAAAAGAAAVPLCERAGMDVESLALSVRHFYALLFTSGGGRGGGGGDAALEPPAVGLMVNVRARHRVKGAVASAVADAHALLVEAVVGPGGGERGATAAHLAPSSGYPPEVGVAVGFRATDKVATVLTGRL